MKSSLSETIFGRALDRVASAVIRHRWLFLWPQIVLFGLCIAYTAMNLKVDASRDNLVGPGKKIHQNYMAFKQEFPAQDDLVVVVESENPEKNRQFVERLGAKLEAETNLFTDVLYRKDFKQTLANYLPFVQRFTTATNLDSLFAMVNSQFLHAKRETNAENDALVKAIPMLDAIIKQATDALRRPGTPPSPGVTALFGASDDDIYITFATGRVYLVTAHAPSEDKNDDAVERLRTLASQTQRE